MRILSPTHQNELAIDDAVSGGEVVLYYRTPTPRERAGFLAMTILRKGKKVKLNAYAAREEYGLEILTGFREGDYGVPGASGEPEPVSSDPASPHYRTDWKALIRDLAGDHIQTLAYVVFEGARASVDMEMDGEDDGDGGGHAGEDVHAPAVDGGGHETGPLGS
jgi:hypothetical protein